MKIINPGLARLAADEPLRRDFDWEEAPPGRGHPQDRPDVDDPLHKQGAEDPDLDGWESLGQMKDYAGREYNVRWRRGSGHHTIQAIDPSVDHSKHNKDDDHEAKITWDAHDGEIGWRGASRSHSGGFLSMALKHHAHKNLPGDVVHPRHSTNLTYAGRRSLESFMDNHGDPYGDIEIALHPYNYYDDDDSHDNDDEEEELSHTSRQNLIDHGFEEDGVGNWEKQFNHPDTEDAIEEHTIHPDGRLYVYSVDPNGRRVQLPDAGQTWGSVEGALNISRHGFAERHLPSFGWTPHYKDPALDYHDVHQPPFTVPDRDVRHLRPYKWTKTTQADGDEPYHSTITMPEWDGGSGGSAFHLHTRYKNRDLTDFDGDLTGNLLHRENKWSQGVHDGGRRDMRLTHPEFHAAVQQNFGRPSETARGVSPNGNPQESTWDDHSGRFGVVDGGWISAQDPNSSDPSLRARTLLSYNWDTGQYEGRTHYAISRMPGKQMTLPLHTVSGSSSIKSYLPFADLQGLTPEQAAFQRTHPMVRRQILDQLRGGNYQRWAGLARIHQAQSRVDAVRAMQGRRSPYAHPSRPQPWQFNPYGNTTVMPRVAAGVEPGDTQYGLGHGHTAPADGPAFHDPEDYLPDVYEHPEYYVSPRDPRDPLVHRSGMENWKALVAARGNPDADVRIYRAVPHGITEIEGHTNPSGASWVSASPSYAKRHAEAESCPACGGDMQVISGMAKARELHNEGYLEEWGYTGDPIRDESALTECPEGAYEARKAAEERFNREASEAVHLSINPESVACMSRGKNLKRTPNTNEVTCRSCRRTMQLGLRDGTVVHEYGKPGKYHRIAASPRSKPIFDAEMGGPSGKLQKLMDNMTEVDPDPHLSDHYGDAKWHKDYECLVAGRHGFQGGYEAELDEAGGVSYHRGGVWTNHLGKRIPVAHVIKPVLAKTPDKMVSSDPDQEVQYFVVSSIPGDEGQLYRTLQEAVGRPASLGNRWDHPGRGYEPRAIPGIRPTAAAEPNLSIQDYDGREGNNEHITRNEYGHVPLSWLSRMHGMRGERPDQHRNYQGEEWEHFKQSVANGEPGYSSPIFIMVRHGEEPRIAEGNHRRDAYKENALAARKLMADTLVPVEIRYFGHAERQGTVGERAMRRTAAAREQWQAGERPWFEYHCWEDPESSDAEAWYRSHQQVEVLDHQINDAAPGSSLEERVEDGTPHTYTVRFSDGHEHTVFEDELSDSPADWYRPDPPVRKTAAVDESGLKAAGIAVIAMDTGRVLMQQRALNPIMCPCGQGVTWDESNGYQHDDGSVSHDEDEFYGQTVSDLLDQGHPIEKEAGEDDEPGKSNYSLQEALLGMDVDDEFLRPEQTEQWSEVVGDHDFGTFRLPPPKVNIWGPIEKTAMPRDDEFLRSLKYEISSNVEPKDPKTGFHKIKAVDSNGDNAGYMEWDAFDGRILDLAVARRNHRKGLATELYSRAHEHSVANGFSPPEHDWENLSDDAKNWIVGRGEEPDEDSPLYDDFHRGFDRTAALEFDPNEGTWEFPGGKLDEGESPRQAAIREFREEVGQDLPPGVFVGAWVSPGGIAVSANYIPGSADVDPLAGLVDDPNEMYGISGEYIVPGRGGDTMGQRVAGSQPLLHTDLPEHGFELVAQRSHDGQNTYIYKHRSASRGREVTHLLGVVELADMPGRYKAKYQVIDDQGKPFFGGDFSAGALHEDLGGIDTDPLRKMVGHHNAIKTLIRWDFQRPREIAKPTVPSQITHPLWTGDNYENIEKPNYIKPTKIQSLNSASDDFSDDYWSRFDHPPEYADLVGKGWDAYDMGDRETIYTKGLPEGNSLTLRRSPNPNTGSMWWTMSDTTQPHDPASGQYRGSWHETLDHALETARSRGHNVDTHEEHPEPPMTAEEQAEMDRQEAQWAEWRRQHGAEREGGPDEYRSGRTAARKAPVYKCFIYLIKSERDIDLSKRELANPDDPDGDMSEQSAWWEIEHAKKNPALRAEVKKGTPWAELELWADKSVRSNKEVKEAFAKLAMGLSQYDIDNLAFKGHENPVYLRFGDWPADERSMNHITGIPEYGVSVYDLNKWGQPVDPDSEMDRGVHRYDPNECGPMEEYGCETHNRFDGERDEEYNDDTADMLRGHLHDARVERNQGPRRQAHLVTGTLEGFGHDDEPLLRNLKIVGHWPCDVHKFIPGLPPQTANWCAHPDHDAEAFDKLAAQEQVCRDNGWPELRHSYLLTSDGRKLVHGIGDVRGGPVLQSEGASKEPKDVREFNPESVLKDIPREPVRQGDPAAGEPWWVYEPVKKEGTSKCSYCKSPATKEIKHSEGMGLIATCDKHLAKGKKDAAACVPYGGPDPDNINWIHDASVRVAMPTTEHEPAVHGLEGSGEGAFNRKVTLPSGEWLAKSYQHRHLNDPIYQEDVDDHEYFKSMAEQGVDVEEFASRLGHALSDPDDVPIAPEVVRGTKASDPGPTAYVRRFPEYRDMDNGWLDYDDLEHHVKSPRGKLMGYFHSVLSDGDKVDHHNMLLLGDPMESESEKIRRMPTVSIDHTHSSIPEYAESLSGIDTSHGRRMTFFHQGELSPYAEEHFLGHDHVGVEAPKQANPLAPGDTERAIAAAETLRPWARERGRESWVDAAQKRMRLLGEHAAGTESMFPYKMPHETDDQWSIQHQSSVTKVAAQWVDHREHPDCGCMVKKLNQMQGAPAQGWLVDHRSHGGRVRWKVTDSSGLAKASGKARNLYHAEKDVLDAYDSVVARLPKEGSTEQPWWAFTS